MRLTGLSKKRQGNPVLLKQKRPNKQQTGLTLLRCCFLGAAFVLSYITISLYDPENGDVATPTGIFHSLHAVQQTSDSAGQVTGLENLPEEKVSTSKKRMHKLRFDWTNLPVQSEVAKLFLSHQSDCRLPYANVPFRNRFGLGSDLHVWGQAVCNAMEKGMRVRSIMPWLYLDTSTCDLDQAERSPMLCYFPQSEILCKEDLASISAKKEAFTMTARQGYHCEGVMKKFNVSDFRAGALEYLFRSLSPLLIDEAERQLNVIFPDGVPPDLITVQIRWGDKKVELKNGYVRIEEYIKGVVQILEARRMPKDTANIFLATEDPIALAAFRENAPPGWTIYVDQYHTETKIIRLHVNMEHNISHVKGSNYNENPRIAEDTKGRAGLVALGSLLVAMEANYFVLTTTSNWSRLMNELRKNIVDPRCNGCTEMVDLLDGEW